MSKRLLYETMQGGRFYAGSKIPRQISLLLALRSPTRAKEPTNNLYLELDDGPE